jgi:putative oxidoreductase
MSSGNRAAGRYREYLAELGCGGFNGSRVCKPRRFRVTPKALFATDTAAISTSYGLLLLRAAALSLFLKHGWEKLSGYSTMVQHFPDPLHVGAHAGLAFALLSDGICSLLVLIGLATRPASAVILINLLVAFSFVHHAAYFSNPHVELVVLYILIFSTLLFAGPGRFSIDARLKNK